MVDVARAVGVRLYALCHNEHRACARELEKCGFSREGLLRGYAKFPNVVPIEPRDVLCFATLP